MRRNGGEKEEAPHDEASFHVFTLARSALVGDQLSSADNRQLTTDNLTQELAVRQTCPTLFLNGSNQKRRELASELAR